MISGVLGQYPPSAKLFLLTFIMALAAMIWHLVRRGMADPADRVKFACRPIIIATILAANVTVLGYTGQLEMQDMFYYAGQVASIFIVAQSLATSINVLRTSGSIFMRIVMAPFPLLVTVMGFLSGLYSHSIYITSIHQPPIWANNTYQYVLWATDYFAWIYLAGVLPLLGIIAGIRGLWRRRQARNAGTP